VRKTGKKETFITLVLDKSTSMHNCYGAALDAVNEQIDVIKDNAEKGGETFVSLILFSHIVDVVFENVPAEDLDYLTEDDYQLTGTTALRDAVFTAIDIMEHKERGNKNQGFLVVLISDGQENSSGTTKEELQCRIEECESSGCWTFSYMLDGHAWEDVVEWSQCYNTPIGNMISFTSSGEGTKKAGLYACNAVANYMDSRDKGETLSVNYFHKQDGSAEVTVDDEQSTTGKTK
jgi:uncharacterized protein YegL